MCATHGDVLQRRVNNLVVVGEAVKLEGLQVEENVVVAHKAVRIRLRVEPAACGFQTANQSISPLCAQQELAGIAGMKGLTCWALQAAHGG